MNTIGAMKKKNNCGQLITGQRDGCAFTTPTREGEKNDGKKWEER